NAVAKEDEILETVAVHVGDQRLVVGGPTEVNRLVGDAILVAVDQPLTIAIDDRVARSRAGKVAHQTDIAPGRPKDELQVDDGVEVAVEEELAHGWAIDADRSFHLTHHTR